MAKLFSVTSVQIAILKSNPIKLLVTVHGMASTSGWKNIDLVPIPNSDADGVLDLDFVGTPPTGEVLTRLTPVTTDHVIEDGASKLSGVLVHARSNSLSALVSEGGSISNPGGPTPGIDRFVSARFGDVTTFAIGEEGLNTLAMIPSETMAGIGFEKLPITEKWAIPEKLPVGEKPPVFETDPSRDLRVGAKLSLGEVGPGPGPDPGPFFRTPLGI
jgi:hypothetical protein